MLARKLARKPNCERRDCGMRRIFVDVRFLEIYKNLRTNLRAASSLFVFHGLVLYSSVLKSKIFSIVLVVTIKILFFQHLGFFYLTGYNFCFRAKTDTSNYRVYLY